jgi:hypothetical protein
LSFGKLDSQPRFANSAHPHQGEQAAVRVFQQLFGFVKLSLPADKASGLVELF